MGSDDDMFRIWSGPEGSSHKGLCRASESIERTGAFWCRGYPRVPAGRLVSRWSSAAPAGSLDYQIPRHRPGPVVQKSPVKARLSEQFNPVLSAARWRCQNIGCYMPWALVTVALTSVTSCLRIFRARRTIMNQIEER